MQTRNLERNVDKGKEEAVEKRKLPLSEEGNETQMQQHDGVGW
jgi:hypothetical protein